MPERALESFEALGALLLRPRGDFAVAQVGEEAAAVGLQAEKEFHLKKTAVLEGNLKESRGKLAGRKNYQKLSGIALGGGLVVFGWAAGYALASASRRKTAKYHID